MSRPEVERMAMTALTHSVRAHLLAGYVTALLLVGLTAIGALTATSAMHQGFIQAVQTDGPLMQDVLRRVTLVDDEATGLRGYLLTHDRSFLPPYTTARRTVPAVRARTARLGTTLPGVQPLLASMTQRAVAWERWAHHLLAHPPAGPSTSVAGIAQQQEGRRLFD